MQIKPMIQYKDFDRIDLRIATITQAEPHPNADRLLKLQVDLGQEQRQICAGLQQYYTPKQLVGKQIVMVANLAPRSLRGEESNGMLLAASMTNGDQISDVVVLEPAKPVHPGTIIS